jgi:hypothetical protein
MAAIDYKDLTGLLNKTENNGETDDGVLRAEEFTNLVNNVILNEQGVKASVKKIKFGAAEVTPDSDGLAIIPTESGAKISLTLVSPEGNYKDYMTYMNSFPQFIHKGEDYTVKVKLTFRELIDDVQWPINDKLTINFKVGDKIVGTSDIYDYELDNAAVGDDKRLVTFNFARYFQSNDYNQPVVEIVDKNSRIQSIKRSFKDVYVADVNVNVAVTDALGMCRIGV